MTNLNDDLVAVEAHPSKNITNGRINFKLAPGYAIETAMDQIKIYLNSIPGNRLRLAVFYRDLSVDNSFTLLYVLDHCRSRRRENSFIRTLSSDYYEILSVDFCSKSRLFEMLVEFGDPQNATYMFQKKG